MTTILKAPDLILFRQWSSSTVPVIPNDDVLILDGVPDTAFSLSLEPDEIPEGAISGSLPGFLLRPISVIALNNEESRWET